METGLTARRGWTKVELAIEECFAHQQNFGLSFVRKRRGLLVAFFNRALHALLLTFIAVYTTRCFSINGKSGLTCFILAESHNENRNRTFQNLQ